VSTQAYDDQRSGWATFAAVIMFAVGFARIISAIDLFSDERQVSNYTGGLFAGDSWAWGIWDLLIAAVAILAGMSLLAGGGFGRFLGYVFGVLIIVQGFTVIGVATWYGALAILVGVLVIHGISHSPKGAT
jgi:hypothetical protein